MALVLDWHGFRHWHYNEVAVTPETFYLISLRLRFPICIEKTLIAPLQRDGTNKKTIRLYYSPRAKSNIHHKYGYLELSRYLSYSLLKIKDFKERQPRGRLGGSAS